MSSALIRQALEFVDEEESGQKPRHKRRTRNQIRGPVQDTVRHPYKVNKKRTIKQEPSAQQILERNVEKLLILSKPATDAAIAEKIVERAIKGKPLLEKIEIKVENEKSILFPEEESFTKFEKEYFCS